MVVPLFCLLDGKLKTTNIQIVLALVGTFVDMLAG